LLSKGLLSIDNGDFDLLKIISVAVREMSEGELLQIEKRDDLILLKIFITKLSEKNCNTYRCLLCARSAICYRDELQVENMRSLVNSSEWRFK
jgi:octaprenyl-diphosphate synthase